MRIRCACLAVLSLVLAQPAGRLAPARAEEPPRGPKRLNRLAKERSPYLRQHATNPVDWFPWGPEAFAKARREQKPVFLSIGYAACHWCHVMEHESFENPQMAALLNRTFVCVKVDREERPDLDDIYMNAVYALGRRGGWPMTVVLTPDQKPFWAGTYLPPRQLRSTIQGLNRRWQSDRTGTQALADRIALRVREMSVAPRLTATTLSDTDILSRARVFAAARYDALQGGYLANKKFPPHAKLLYALENGGKHATPTERRHALHTLVSMARGGIHDWVGGGFHRYTVDSHWFLPHFEKMLYDNALLARALSLATALRQGPALAGVAERVFDWIERDLRQPKGGYASSLDADTQGHEGLTYTWTLAELRRVLGAEDAAHAAQHLHATARGNFQEERSRRSTGRNILHGPGAAAGGAAPQAHALAAWRQRLLKTRTKRAQPGLDTKVITAWNGLLLSALATAGTRLPEGKTYLNRGRTLADFIWSQSRAADGGLLRFPRVSGAPIAGFCDDHAHLGIGLLDLAEATGETRYADAAMVLGDRLLAAFEDPSQGGFWSTASDAGEVLIARSKAYRDSPIPSDNGAATLLCLRLYARSGHARFLAAADRALALYRPLLAAPANAFSMATLLEALRLRGRITKQQVRTAAGTPILSLRQGVALVSVYKDRRPSTSPGTTGVRIRVTLDRGWHVNTATPARADLIATGLRVDPGPGQPRLTQVTWPPAAAPKTGPSEVTVAHYAGTFEIRAEVDLRAVKDGPAILWLRLQPCTHETCQEAFDIRLALPLR